MLNAYDRKYWDASSQIIIMGANLPEKQLYDLHSNKKVRPVLLFE